MGYHPISFCHDSGKPTDTHSVLLDRIVAEDLCALFDIVDGLRMTEFESFEVTVEHLPPAKGTFGKLVASWVIGRPREDPVSRIAVVIHLASLIALVLKFEPEGDIHGGRMLPTPDQGVPVTTERKGDG
jgi:hypothetical protein